MENNNLSDRDIKEIEEKMMNFENHTGCDLLLVLANSSDKYNVAPWRFGVLLSCLLILVFSMFFHFSVSYYWAITICLLLLVTISLGNLPILKKFLITDEEIDRECYENAVKYFYTLGLSKVSHKVTAMIMVSLFERKITVLVDEKLKEKITQAELDELVEIMQKHFKSNHMKQGWIESINSLEEKILKDFGGKVSQISVNELSNHLHFV